MKTGVMSSVAAFLGWLLVAVLCVIALFYGVIYIRAIDDCHFVDEGLSDEQVMEAATSYAYRDWLRREKAQLGDNDQSALLSLAEYQQSFPDCCEILDETQMRPEELASRKDQIFFALRAYVRIDSGHAMGRGSEIVYVDACGDLTTNYLP